MLDAGSVEFETCWRGDFLVAGRGPSRKAMSSTNLNRRAVLAGLGALAATPAIGVAAPPPYDSFLVLGDWGRRGNRTQRAVAQAMADRARAIGSRFVVTVGDNFYSDGVAGPLDPHWRQSFAGVYDLQTLHTWYPALGNHDYNGDPDAQVAYSQRFAGWRMDGRHYRQTATLCGGRTLDLFVLDTAPVADPANYPVRKSQIRAQYDWFDREMLASRADWKIVVGHHPIVSSGYQKRVFPRLNRWLEPRLRAYGVQAYMTGHDHHLEEIRSGGVTHIVSGGGAAADPMARRRVEGHVQGWPSAGFAACEIAGDVLRVTFVDAEGRDLGTAQVPRIRADA
jgi:tartrate-resistant acid phosphatase type 5